MPIPSSYHNPTTALDPFGKRIPGHKFDIRKTWKAPPPLPVPSAPDAASCDGSTAERPKARFCDRHAGNASMPGATVRVDVRGMTAAGGHYFPRPGVYYLHDVTPEEVAAMRKKLVDPERMKLVAEICEPEFWRKAEDWLYANNGGMDPNSGFPLAEVKTLADISHSVWAELNEHDRLAKEKWQRDDIAARARGEASPPKPKTDIGTLFSVEVIAGTERVPQTLENHATVAAKTQADTLEALREQVTALSSLAAALMESTKKAGAK